MPTLSFAGIETGASSPTPAVGRRKKRNDLPKSETRRVTFAHRVLEAVLSRTKQEPLYARTFEGVVVMAAVTSAMRCEPADGDCRTAAIASGSSFRSLELTWQFDT